MDLLYNASLLLADAVGIAVVRARPSLRTALAVVAAVLFVALLTAGLAAGDAFFHLLRLYSFALFGHLPVLLAGSAIALGRKAARAAALLGAGGAAILLVAADAFLIEPRWLEVTHVRLRSAKLERPLRIAVVADLQTDHAGAWEKSVLERVMAERPDLILLPGDYVQADRRERPGVEESLRRLLGEVGLTAPLGAYATQGNVDPPGWPALFAGSGVTALERTASVELDGLRLTGLGLWDSFDLRSGLPAPPPGRFHVVFGHAPDFALGEVEADLLVAGHTHGGQVRLPGIGPLIRFSDVPRSWAAGTTSLPGGRLLVVSRGIGMERGRAPRMRFRCRPQLVFIEVHPEDG